MSIKLEHIEQVYLIGIGGIGMSALARWFKANGRNVFGYDRVDTMLTSTLINEGIGICFEDKINEIPEEVLDDQENTLVIYTPAVPSNHKQLNFLRDAGYPVMKRSAVLGIISKIFLPTGTYDRHLELIEENELNTFRDRFEREKAKQSLETNTNKRLYLEKIK